MSETSSYSKWLDMQLSSDSDLQHTSNNRPITSASTSYIYEIQATSLLEDDVNSTTRESSAIQSSWLQLQLSSEDSSEVLSDRGCNKGDSIRSFSQRYLDDIDDSDSEISQHDDLSDILEEYIQSHGLLSETEDSLSDDDDPADDYQPGSAEEYSPAWIQTSQADDSAGISEVQNNIKSPVNIDPMLNLARPTLWLPALE
ncbi:hypothetical protein BD769DRAFT_1663142 [Suillus cothurnatus]|nr:hypothetical protein BD769DRAFT_1663142 [Suillus cothurnatus]